MFDPKTLDEIEKRRREWEEKIKRLRQEEKEHAEELSSHARKVW